MFRFFFSFVESASNSIVGSPSPGGPQPWFLHSVFWIFAIFVSSYLSLVEVGILFYTYFNIILIETAKSSVWKSSFSSFSFFFVSILFVREVPNERCLQEISHYWNPREWSVSWNWFFFECDARRNFIVKFV